MTSPCSSRPVTTDKAARSKTSSQKLRRIWIKEYRRSLRTCSPRPTKCLTSRSSSRPSKSPSCCTTRRQQCNLREATTSTTAKCSTSCSKETPSFRSLLEANNFNFTESHEWNILWSSSSCKSYLYEGLNEYQRINHFPQSYEITRKDRLCFNYVKMQERFGRQAFDFIPDTYILPNEFHDFHAHY